MSLLMALALITADHELDSAMADAAYCVDHSNSEMCRKPSLVERAKMCFELCDLTYTIGSDRLCRMDCDQFIIRLVQELTR